MKTCDHRQTRQLAPGEWHRKPPGMIEGSVVAWLCLDCGMIRLDNAGKPGPWYEVKQADKTE